MYLESPDHSKFTSLCSNVAKINHWLLPCRFSRR